MSFQRPPGEPKYASSIHVPAKLSSIETGKVDAHGRPIRVACVDCHSLRDEAVSLPTEPSELVDFHRGLTFSHGSLECASCHDSTAPQRLRMAAGKSVEMRNVVDLCGQCHGPQLRNYRHGAHGGKVGYWDLSRGPQSRNNCVDCHDPHAPQIPTMQPVHPPRDRFLHVSKSHTFAPKEVHP